MSKQLVTSGQQVRTFDRLARRLSADVPLLVCILLLPFALFWAEVLGRQVFFYHDVQYYFFPYHKLVVDILRAGHLPLWNPYAFSGIPLLGDGQTAMFYPPNWLFFLLSPIHALTVIVLLHFGIAGASMTLYVRSLGLGRTAALVAALAFMFNGFLVARVVHLSIMAGAALVPMVFWSVERMLQRRTLARFIIAAVVVGVQALTGHPQVPIYTAVGIGLYVLVIAGREGWRFNSWRLAVNPLLQLLAVYMVGYALAAIQLVPWVEFARFSPRAAGANYEFVTFDSFRGFDWLLLLFPYALGGPSTSWLQPVQSTGVPVYIWERMAYVGLLPLALAVVGLAQLRTDRGGQQQMHRVQSQAAFKRDRLWAIMVVLLVMGLIAAGSSTPFGRLVYLLPAIGKLRAYARSIIVAVFALTGLSAYGVQQLVSFRRTRGQPMLVAPQVAGGLLLAIVSVVLLVTNSELVAVIATKPEPPYRATLLRSLLLHRPTAYVPLAIAVASAALLWSARRGLDPWKQAALVGVLALDMLSIALTFNPTTEPTVFEGEPASVAFLKDDESLYRTASFVSDDRLSPRVAQAQLAISWAIAYGIEDINGFNSLQPRRYTDVLFGADVGDVSYGFLGDLRLLDPTNRLLSMLNVKYALVQGQLPAAERTVLTGAAGEGTTSDGWQRVYADDSVSIYRNPRPLPRAYFVPRVDVVRDARAILASIKQPGFEPARQALVEGELSQVRARALSRRGQASVRVERVSPNELRLHTETADERFLVLSEMWFPGWRAELNGEALPIYRTNYLLRGLVVPAGTNTITMYYRPTSAFFGAGVTLVTMAGIVAALVMRARRRQAA